jgi:hypothetical protein
MPVTEVSQKQQTIYQRQQYAKSGLGRWHWDKRDQLAMFLIVNMARVSPRFIWANWSGFPKKSA